MYIECDLVIVESCLDHVPMCTEHDLEIHVVQLAQKIQSYQADYLP
jgi:hypothetical protein